ncbi:MAG: hypothetical protein K0R79_3602 [Stenotrophomonas indicatrix]|nr:hypothetical protein [Stenotrophomonas indicatrix]
MRYVWETNEFGCMRVEAAGPLLLRSFQLCTSNYDLNGRWKAFYGPIDLGRECNTRIVYRHVCIDEDFPNTVHVERGIRRQRPHVAHRLNRGLDIDDTATGRSDNFWSQRVKVVHQSSHRSGIQNRKVFNHLRAPFGVQDSATHVFDCVLQVNELTSQRSISPLSDRERSFGTRLPAGSLRRNANVQRHNRCGSGPDSGCPACSLSCPETWDSQQANCGTCTQRRRHWRQNVGLKEEVAENSEGTGHRWVSTVSWRDFATWTPNIEVSLTVQPLTVPEFLSGCYTRRTAHGLWPAFCAARRARVRVRVSAPASLPAQTDLFA